MGHRIDRIWLLGGVVVLVLLGLGGWFLLIHPKYADASAVSAQVDDGRAQLIKLNREVAVLNGKKKDKPKLLAAKKANLAALPVDDSGIPAFLRQLQTSRTAAGVDVSGITVGTPNKSETNGNIYEISITMLASGDATNLSQFLNQLQTVQPRAALINSVGLSAGSVATDPNALQASLSLTVFVSSSTGSSPTLTTK